MDLVLKTGYWNRQVGPEKIKITSLGKPTTDSTYTDNWQRHWKVYVWPQPYINVEVVMFALPVPDGYAIMMRMNPSIITHDSLSDLKALTDFFDVDYGGTLAQWKEFLAESSLLPDVLKAARIDADYGKRFSYDSNKIASTIHRRYRPLRPITCSPWVLATTMNTASLHWKPAACRSA